MDTSGGFWIVHSTPKFPPFWSDGYKWAHNGDTNGQTFLCISMTYSEMDNIGIVFQCFICKTKCVLDWLKKC